MSKNERLKDIIRFGTLKAELIFKIKEEILKRPGGLEAYNKAYEKFKMNELKKPICPECGKCKIYLDDQDKGNGFWKIGCNSCKFEDDSFFELPEDAVAHWYVKVNPTHIEPFNLG